MDFFKILNGGIGVSMSNFDRLWAKKFSGWPETELTGLLPLTFLAEGSALTDYRIYGSESGAGVQTENIFDYNDCFSNLENYSQYFSLYKMNAEPNTSYTLHTSLSEGMAVSRETPFIICSSTDAPTTANYGVSKTSPLTITTASDGLIYVYVRIRMGTDPSIPVDMPTLEGFEAGDWLTIIKGSTVPTSYIPYGYKIPILNTSGVTENEFPFAEEKTITWCNATIVSDGKGNFSINGSVSAGYSNTINLSAPYTIPTSIGAGGSYCFYAGNSEANYYIIIELYDENGSNIESWVLNQVWRKSTTYSNMAGKTIAKIGFRLYGDETNVNITVSPMFSKNASLTEYVPYRYQSNYDLFIGDSKLGATEYLDFSEQKIYKDVSGTLTPTDPPVALPAITTYLGENTLSSEETVGEVTIKGKIKETP